MRKNREETPAYLHGSWEICRKRAAIFLQLSFRDSPFLYPVFAIITGILKHLFTEPPSSGYISHRDSSSTPGAFYTHFYNHAHRLRLEKLLHLELSRSPNGFFKALLDPGGRNYLSSPPQIPRGRGVDLESRWLICNGHSPTDKSFRSSVRLCNGRGRWPKPTVLFWCGNLSLVLSQFASLDPALSGGRT
jgi:hypothetical protein